MVMMCWRRLDGGAGSRENSLGRAAVRVSALPQGVQDERVPLASREPQQIVQQGRAAVAGAGSGRRGAQARPETRPSRRRTTSGRSVGAKWSERAGRRLRSDFSRCLRRFRELGLSIGSVSGSAADCFRSVGNISVDQRQCIDRYGHLADQQFLELCPGRKVRDASGNRRRQQWSSTSDQSRFEPDDYRK